MKTGLVYAASLLAVVLLCLPVNSCKQFMGKKAGEPCIRLPMEAKLRGFDPALATDGVSVTAQGLVYEPLYQYSYLEEGYQLEPCLASGMGEFSGDGLTYTAQIQQGVVFQDDPCFRKTGGKGREVVAEDIVYGIKRLADVKVRSTGWWTFDEKVQGLEEFRQMTMDAGSRSEVDYSMPVSGLRAIDKYTIQFTLKRPYPQLPFILAMMYTVPVPHEAVEYYGVEYQNHPVGTGPYKLESWDRGLRLVFTENPTYREVRFPAPPAGCSDESVLACVGKRLPLMPRVEMHIFLESQPKWLNFLLGLIDRSGIPKDNFDAAVQFGDQLSPELEKKGIQLSVQPRMIVSYVIFNMEDKWLGKNKKLRQAISLAYDSKRRIELFFNNRAIQATHILPPLVPGHIPDYENPYIGPDLEKARVLMAEAGYPNGEGLPPLTFETTGGGTTTRQMAEMFVNEMAQLGITLKVVTNTWPQFTKKIKSQKFQIGSSAWFADYPDAENFLQTLYGENEAPGPNNSSYKNPEYDRLFEEVAAMQDSPNRRDLIRKMIDIAVEDCPLIYTYNQTSYMLSHDWYRNYRFRDIGQGYLKYHWIDTELRKTRIQRF